MLGLQSLFSWDIHPPKKVTNAMKDELHALENNQTWNIVKLPPGKKAVRDLQEEVYMQLLPGSS